MSNSYFQFKQFRVEQGDCAMKVTTDGCILGAWAGFNNPERILDIGTGTGLLSLMLAQRYNCSIDAVEIDKLAADEALANFRNSPWNERLYLYHQNIKEFVLNCTHKYDLIISNPPFFNSNLKSTNVEKNLAIHDSSLSKDLLLEIIEKMLSVNGRVFILYPEFESHQMLDTVEDYQLIGRTSLIVKNKPVGKIFRKVIELSKSNFAEDMIPKEIRIRNNQNKFSDRYIELLKPYYLHF